MTTPDPPPGSPPVEVRRSKRRRRTVQAYMRDDTVVVLLPARMTKAEERFWVAEMVGRLERQEQRRQRRRNRTDEELLARAKDLSGRYLDGRARPAEVRWVTNQNDRWGSCTPTQGTIRLSDRLRDFPTWVSDYVLLHELAHLLEPGHGQAFWRLVNRYPKTERARGYLEGVLAAATPTPATLDDTTLDDDVLGIAGEPEPEEQVGSAGPVPEPEAEVGPELLPDLPWQRWGLGADAGRAAEVAVGPELPGQPATAGADLGAVAAREESGPSVGPADSLQQALPTVPDTEAAATPESPPHLGGAPDEDPEGEQDALW